MIDLNSIVGFASGIVVAGGAAIAFISRRISPSEASDIYNKTMRAIDDYKAAKTKGLTPEDEIKVAEEALEAISTFVKDLEN